MATLKLISIRSILFYFVLLCLVGCGENMPNHFSDKKQAKQIQKAGSSLEGILLDSKGNTIDLSTYNDKTTVLLYSASTCGACQIESKLFLNHCLENPSFLDRVHFFQILGDGHKHPVLMNWINLTFLNKNDQNIKNTFSHLPWPAVIEANNTDIYDQYCRLLPEDSIQVPCLIIFDPQSGTITSQRTIDDWENTISKIDKTIPPPISPKKPNQNDNNDNKEPKLPDKPKKPEETNDQFQELIGSIQTHDGTIIELNSLSTIVKPQTTLFIFSISSCKSCQNETIHLLKSYLSKELDLHQIQVVQILGEDFWGSHDDQLKDWKNLDFIDESTLSELKKSSNENLTHIPWTVAKDLNEPNHGEIFKTYCPVDNYSVPCVAIHHPFKGLTFFKDFLTDDNWVQLFSHLHDPIEGDLIPSKIIKREDSL